MCVVDANCGEFLEHRGHHAAQLGECLNAGETTTDHHDRQQAVASRSGRHICRQVEVVDDAVSNGDRLFDGLHPNGEVGNSRNRERSRHRTSGDHDVVIVQAEGGLTLRSDGYRLAAVVNPGHTRSDDAALVQVATQRNNRVTGLNGTRCDLREERLIGHVGKWIDDDHFRFSATEKLLEFVSSVETGVTAAHNHNSSHEAPKTGRTRRLFLIYRFRKRHRTSTTPVNTTTLSAEANPTVTT